MPQQETEQQVEQTVHEMRRLLAACLEASSTVGRHRGDDQTFKDAQEALQVQLLKMCDLVDALAKNDAGDGSTAR